MANVGTATLAVIPSFSGFQGHLERGTSGALSAAGSAGGLRFGDAAGRSAGKRFGSIFKTAAKASLIGVAGAGALAVKFGSDAVSAASDQKESINAVNVAYGKQGHAVQQLGKRSAKSLALPRTEFNELATRFSAFTKIVAGGNGKKTVKTLDDLTKRAGDFASVFNLEVGDAAELFQSGLAGETEPLRRFGLDMSAASVEAFAYAKGIAESGSKLTEAQKVQARYGLLMKQTNKTQGDLINTSDSLANRQRFLNARWDDAKAKLGTALLPVMEDFVGFITDKGLPAVEDFSDWFTKKGIPAFKRFADKQGPRAVAVFKGIRDFAEDAKPFAEDIVGAFDNMPGWVKKILVGGALGGLTAKKLGLKITGGLLSKGATPLNPLFVTVTNPGFGGGDGVPKGGSKVAPLLKGAGTVALGTAIAGGITAGVAKALGPQNHALLGAGSGGTGGLPAGSHFFDLDDEKIDQHNHKLSETKKKWIDARLASKDYAFQVHNGIPRSALTTVTNWTLENRKAREYLATILAIRDQHITGNFTDFGSTAGQPPNHGGGGGGKGGNDGLMAASRGRPTVIIHGDVKTPDAKQFLSDLQRRSISGAADGWG